MVLTGKYHEAKAGILQGLHPLIGIQMIWDENGGILCPIAPLLIGEGIDPKVDKGSQLQLLPRLLLLGGDQL